MCFVDIQLICDYHFYQNSFLPLLLWLRIIVYFYKSFPFFKVVHYADINIETVSCRASISYLRLLSFLILFLDLVNMWLIFFIFKLHAIPFKVVVYVYLYTIPRLLRINIKILNWIFLNHFACCASKFHLWTCVQD